jgi:SagB-type dehydrogenase family enzyme
MTVSFDIPAAPYVLAFQETVTLVAQDVGVAIQVAGRSVPLGCTSPGFVAAIRVLAAGGATEDELAATVTAKDGPMVVPVLHFYLEQFEQLGLLVYTLRDGASALSTLVPGTIRAPAARPGRPDPGASYVLSRFAYLRREADHLVLASPRGHARVLLHDGRAAAFCHALAQPRTAAELASALPGATDAMVLALLGLLLGCGALTVDGPGGEADDQALALWSFHELLFHTQSRLGRQTGPTGGTFRFAESMDPLPVLKPRMPGARIALYRPDLDALQSHDIPLTRVLEERRSIRTHGERPLHVDQIGELLYRAARIRSMGTSSGDYVYPTSSRPYPGGGACYELELYLVVHACEGLAPGLYHHDPLEHALTHLAAPQPALDALLASARKGMQAEREPQTLIVVTARFGRVMWKYEAMGYALILKDVGALYQTLYLVATAMGLAPCALGNGDTELFAAAAGLDPAAEASVGEFALGSRAD